MQGAHWVGTWTTSPVPVDEIALCGQTLRMIGRTSFGGGTLRVRLSNACGAGSLAIGGARIALRAEGAGIVPGSDRPLTFGGEATAAIAAGAPLLSDPVALDVPPLTDVATSIYLPGDVPESFGVTGHGNTHQSGYISPPGDFTAAEVLPVQRETDAWLFVSGIDVVAPANTAGIVTFGDSLTDGNLSTLDANARWPDRLARRLAARRGGRPAAVMNHGIGGNRILHDLRGDSGLRRFDRDVLAQSGATHVIVLLGINDIRNRRCLAEEIVTADQMIAGLGQLAARARLRGLKVYGGTLLPFEKETFFAEAWTPEGDAKRRAVNDWIRSGRAFDAVIDFETTLRDPSYPTRLLPAYDCGDHLHPNDRGYAAMGDAIDLALFD